MTTIRKPQFLSLLLMVLSFCAHAQQVVGWGDNAASQLNAPVGLYDIRALAGGDRHTLALHADGTVEGWGANDLGQIAIPLLKPVKAIAASGNQSWALQEDGTLVGWGDRSLGSLKVVPPLQNVVSVKAGDGYAMALLTDGTVHVWGDVAWSVPVLTDVKAIAAGGHHSLALLTDGTVVAWGENSKGQSTVPAGLSNVWAIAAGLNHSVALLANGTAVAWGDNSQGQTETAGLDNIKAVVCGNEHTLYLKADGTLAGRGNDALDQRQPPPGLTPIVTIAAGARHSMALTSATLWLSAWGNNVSGQGNVPEGYATDVISVSGGASHNAALRADGTVFCWGDNSFQQTDVPSGLNNVKEVLAIEDRTMALKADGTLVVWGLISNQTSGPPAGLSNVISVSGQRVNTVALLANGTVEGWGLRAPSYAGAPLMKEVAAGLKSTVGIAGDGGVKTFGDNTWNQIGIDPGLLGVIRVSCSFLCTFTITAAGLAQSYGVDSDYILVQIPSGLTGIQDISAGATHSLALLTNGTVNAWGTDFYGQITIPPGLSHVVQISAGEQHSLALSFLPVVVPPNAPPSFTKGPDVTVPEDSGPQSISRWATHIYPGIGEPTQTVHFEIVQDYDASLFAVAPQLDNTGKLTFTPSPNAYGQTVVKIFAVDNGGGLPEQYQSAQQSFIITVAPVNDPPSFIGGADITVLEDSPVISQPWASSISAGPLEQAQTISFQLAGFDRTLFSQGPTIDANGLLTFTPAPNANGVASMTVIISDNGGGQNIGTSLPLTITILPVNDAPVFDPLVDVTIPVNSAPRKIIITGLSPGPINESDQTLVVSASFGSTVLVDNFSVTYTSGTQATLEFLPNTFMMGSTDVEITVKDNGGMANGGVDETRHRFTLTIENAVQQIFVPTAFSPNDDQVNDVFRVRGAGIKSLELSVFDVSGQRVYYTTNVDDAIQFGWNGTKNGNALPIGSYTWMLKGQYLDDTDITYQGKQYGQVLLMR